MTKKLFGKMTTLLMLFAMSVMAFGQGYTPIRGMGVEAKPVNGSGICLACYNGSMNPVIDANLDNSVSMGSFATLVSGNGISVKNTNTIYPAGFITGFNVDLGTSVITASFLSNLRISTYKGGVLQETSNSSTLLSVPAFGGTKTRIFLHFKTTKAFDEVRLYQVNVLSVFSALNIYYAFAFDPNKVPVENNGICDDIIAGNGVDGNVSGSSNFLAPLSYVNDREKIGDGDKNSYGSIVLPVGLLGSYSVGVLDKNQVYPSGNKAGFVIEPDDQGKLLSAEFLKNITIETYLFGQLQDSKNLSDGGGLINIKVLRFGSNKQKISLTTTKPFNEVRLKITQTVGVNFGALKVFYAFEEPQSCDCNEYIQTTGTTRLGDIVPGASWTGTSGTIFGLTNITNTGNVVDTNISNFSTVNFSPINLLLPTARLTVKSNTGDYPAGTFGGFTLTKSANLFSINALDYITITFYKGTTATESRTAGGLFSGQFFTSATNQFYVGFTATKPFDRMKIEINPGIGITLAQQYYIYNAFVQLDDDQDGVPNCNDKCPNGNDSIDNNGNGIPDCAEGCSAVNDKSPILDSDGDGIPDACDGDSDNDGIPDVLEDLNGNGKFEDDDVDGDKLIVAELGDGISSYLDLDSDNDGILDLFESGIPTSIIDQIDVDHNGVIDANVPTGNNGIADVLETSPDSGIMKYQLKNIDGDDKPDFIDLKSNNIDFDLYAIGKDNLDTLGGGFISTINDADADGIQAVVDTDLVKKGSPNSPLSPYASFAKNAGLMAKSISESDVKNVINDVKIYPNPVKTGENLNIKTEEEGTFTMFSAQGQLIKSGKFSGNAEVNTASLPTGVYIIKVETKTTVKSYKVIVK
ncbi:T9SS type A sorting domain-containing protein [Chryseobacterium sp. MMS23-Vi53]|uniref:T9SS type A sorting domain-containing protein n=1 Tax=Chryseobacterium sp. MMS23-Vi53 TaxID=3386644 RepID=UPI0039ECADB2